MAELADRGVVGFKAFLCDSGLPEFPRADDLTLFEGLREAARLGLPVAVHAESQEIIARPHATNREWERPRNFLASRPVIAELEAIQRATLLAREAGAKLHIVHVSSGRGVALAAEARAQGTDVSIETCPHYLFFTEDDVERLGAVAKCAPPLRSALDQDALWTQLLAGTVDIVASDHSPAPPGNEDRRIRTRLGAGSPACSQLSPYCSTEAIIAVSYRSSGFRRSSRPSLRGAFESHRRAPSLLAWMRTWLWWIFPDRFNCRPNI